jgi:predicted dienelactone hydrolase
VTYPTDGGPFPVILFSHAVGGSKDDHAALIESWARAGYVCIQPNHVDSSQMGGPGRSTLSAWPTRPADLSLIIDQLDAIEQADQALNGKLDHSRIGAAGHYIGSLAAGLLVGMRGFPAPGVDPVGFRDERVSAALMMSPVGRGQGLTESAWADMHGPVMVVTGEGDQSRRTGNPGDWRTEPFQFMPPGDKYLVWANELGEPSDGDWDQWAGPAAEPIEAATVAFWDAYLGRDGRARERLESGEIEADFAAAIEIRTKLLDRPAEEELVDFTEPGRYDIASIEELILHDRDRGKDLRIWINYPIGDGPFPVVVFSHGAWASRGHYQPLTQFWASHGYVTIQPSHSDSRDLGGSPDRRAFRDWPSRPADVSFILDSLAALVELAPQLAGKLDPQHIGVAGHSFGANTAQIVGGAVPYVQGQPQPMADPRADAIVLLSPQGLGAQLTESSWDSMTSPTLHMTGSRDPGRNLQDPGWRLHPFEYSPPGHKYLVWVEGMDHGYGGMGGAGFEPATDGISYAPNPEHLEITRSVTTAFLDAYLKGSDAGRAFLEGPSPWTDVTITTK